MVIMETLISDVSSQARINCRINFLIKKRAEDAAEILGQSITSFTEAALAEKAEEVFKRFGTLNLSERDFDKFVETINNPPAPTAKLKKAAEEYKRLREENPESNL